MNIIDEELNKFDKEFNKYGWNNFECTKFYLDNNQEVYSDDIKLFLKQSLERVLDKAIESLPKEVYCKSFLGKPCSFCKGFNWAILVEKDNLERLKNN